MKKTIEQIKLKWQKHNRDNGLSWNEVAELVNEVAKTRNETPPKSGAGEFIELVYLKIESALNSVKMLHVYEDETSHLPLIDFLCNESSTLKKGKEEIENIIDDISHELDPTLHQYASQQGDGCSIIVEAYDRAIGRTYCGNCSETLQDCHHSKYCPHCGSRFTGREYKP